MWPHQNQLPMSQYPATSISEQHISVAHPQNTPGGNAMNDWAAKAAQWAQQKQLNDQNQMLQHHQTHLAFQQYPQYQPNNLASLQYQPNLQIQPGFQSHLGQQYQHNYHPNPQYRPNPNQQFQHVVPYQQPTPLLMADSVRHKSPHSLSNPADMQKSTEMYQERGSADLLHSGMLLSPQVGKSHSVVPQQNQQLFNRSQHTLPPATILNPLISESKETSEVKTSQHIHARVPSQNSPVSVPEPVKEAKVLQQTSKMGEEPVLQCASNADKLSIPSQELQSSRDIMSNDKMTSSAKDQINTKCSSENGRQYSSGQESLLMTRDKYVISSQKAIPGLDFVMNKQSSQQDMHPDETTGLGNYMNRDPQRPHLQNLSSVSKESSQMINSLGKIVSQLKALHDVKGSQEPKTMPKNIEKQDEASRKVAALLENESDSETEESTQGIVNVKSPILMNDTREFQGFDLNPGVVDSEELPSRIPSEHNHEQSTRYPVYQQRRMHVPQNFSQVKDPLHIEEGNSARYYRPESGSYKYEMEQDYPPRNNPEYHSRRVLVNPDFHQDKQYVHDSTCTREARIPPSNYVPPRDEYHFEDIPSYTSMQSPGNSRQRIPVPRSHLYNTLVNSVDEFSDRFQLGYNAEGDHPPTYGEHYHDKHHEQYLENLSQPVHDNQSYSHEPISQSQPYENHVPDDSSMLLLNLQSVDYDHGRVMKANDDIQNKSLPNWLRKELEELELKKMKDRESDREIKRRKRSSNMKSWKEEMAEDEEREFNDEDLPPYKRVVIDSKEGIEKPEIGSSNRKKLETEKGNVYEEGQVQMVAKVRDMLTDVLLEVTNSEMLLIANEVLGCRDDSDKSSATLLPGLSLYSSPSDFDDFPENESSQFTDRTQSAFSPLTRQQQDVVGLTEQSKELQEQYERTQEKCVINEYPAIKFKINSMNSQLASYRPCLSVETESTMLAAFTNNDKVVPKSLKEEEGLPKKKSRSENVQQTTKGTVMEELNQKSHYSSHHQSISTHQSTSEPRKDTHQSRSGSNKDSRRSKSGSRKDSHRSRSGSRKDSHRSRSGSHKDSHQSRSGSRKDSHRSKSGSRKDSHRSRSGSRKDSHQSRSGSHKDSHQSRSGSRKDSRRSRSGSRKDVHKNMAALSNRH